METADIFPWNENFETGIPRIDEQHQTIVRLLNMLARHFANRSDVPTLNSIFKELTDYAAFHFKTEEAVWAAYIKGDKWEADHALEHGKFIASILDLKDRENSKPLDEVVEDILAFLTHWLAFHILENDKRLANVVIGIQSGLPLDEAKTYAEGQMSQSLKLLLDTILSMYDTLTARTLQLTREIIERQRAEEKLHLAAVIIENTLEQICITDPCANIIDFNPAFLQSTELTHDEVTGQNLKVLKSGLEADQIAQVIWNTLDEYGHWSGELLTRTKAGEIVSEWLSISEVKDQEGITTNYIAIFTNISQLALRQRRLERAAHYDALTKLPNRLLLSDRLELAMLQADRTQALLAVCFMDLDGFKPINDHYGHAVGDLVLLTTAQRIKAILRGNDTVARVGGDEFVILLNDIKAPDDCRELLERQATEVARPIAISAETGSVAVTASIGVVFYPIVSKQAETLLLRADQAMYRAKELGKACFHIDTELSTEKG